MAEQKNPPLAYVAGASIDQYQTLTWGTTAGTVVVAGYLSPFAGIAANDAEIGEYVDVITGGDKVTAVAAGTIDRLTSTVPTVVVCATAGKVATIPTATGAAYNAVGPVAVDQANATDGQYISIKIQPGKIYVP